MLDQIAKLAQEGGEVNVEQLKTEWLCSFHI